MRVGDSKCSFPLSLILFCQCSSTVGGGDMQFEPQTLWIFELGPGVSPQCYDTLVDLFICSSPSSVDKVKKDNKTRDCATYWSSLWNLLGVKKTRLLSLEIFNFYWVSFPPIFFYVMEVLWKEDKAVVVQAGGGVRVRGKGHANSASHCQCNSSSSSQSSWKGTVRGVVVLRRSERMSEGRWGWHETFGFSCWWAGKGECTVPWNQSKGAQDTYSPGCSVGHICSNGMFMLHSW